MHRDRGNKSKKLTYCSSLQPVVVCNSVKSKVTFQSRSEITWPSVDSFVAWFPCVWKGKANTTDYSTKWFFLICWFFFYICCNLSDVSNIQPRQQICYESLHFLHPFSTKHVRICVTLIWFEFHCLIKVSTRETFSRKLFVTWCSACMV